MTTATVTRRRGTKNKVVNRLAIVVFILIVIISGVGLNASRNIDNPFTVFNQLFSQQTSGGMREQRLPDANMQRPPQGGGERMEGGGTLQIGGILFNIWYLFATSAVVIILQKPIGFMIERLRRRIQPTAPPRRAQSSAV